MEQLAKYGPDAYLKNLNIITTDSVPERIAPERFYILAPRDKGRKKTTWRN